MHRQVRLFSYTRSEVPLLVPAPAARRLRIGAHITGTGGDASRWLRNHDHYRYWYFKIIFKQFHMLIPPWNSGWLLLQLSLYMAKGDGGFDMGVQGVPTTSPRSTGVMPSLSRRRMSVCSARILAVLSISNTSATCRAVQPWLSCAFGEHTPCGMRNIPSMRQRVWTDSHHHHHHHQHHQHHHHHG